MLRRCKHCEGTVQIIKTTDERGRSYWIVAGRGMNPCKCGPFVKMRSPCFYTLSGSDSAYDELVQRWNRERGMPDDGDRN